MLSRIPLPLKTDVLVPYCEARVFVIFVLDDFFKFDVEYLCNHFIIGL